MPNTLQNLDWDTLLPRIREGKCTPFIGAGACEGSLPLGAQIAQEWAQEHGYPLEDESDLARVAQYLAVTHDPMFPKETLIRRFQESDCQQPDFGEADEPHSVLAKLPLPVYLTTNYDDFMVRALRSGGKDPHREICRWNRFIEQEPSVFDLEEGFEPTVARPVVFHLHGREDLAESLVLTEDDYLDFLVSVWRRQVLPLRIERALSGASLLFVGYSLRDWTFRVLFRGIVGSMEGSLRRISIAVQLGPDNANARRYLDSYYNHLDVKVYWGTARQFAAELATRWRAFCGHGA